MSGSDGVIEGVSITYSDRYYPKDGHRPLVIDSEDFKTLLSDFHSCKVSLEFTARKLIELLFDRDFSGKDDSKWHRNRSSVTLINTDAVGDQSYDCEESADWDSKDINSRAKSRAIIVLSADRTRIRLDDYGFNCSG